MHRSLSRSLLAALALSTVAFAPMTAQADEVLAAQFPHISSVPVSALPPLGSVPTFYVNLDPNTMAQLLRKDLDEGRRHFDKMNPSYLDPHIIKLKNSPVGSASENGFSSNSTICITTISTSVPYHTNTNPNTNDTSGSTATNASRTCATATAPINRNTAALTNFYSSYQVAQSQTLITACNVLPCEAHNQIERSKAQLLRLKSFVETDNSSSTEGWGIAYFDDEGSNGRLQEIIWTAGFYLVN